MNLILRSLALLGLIFNFAHALAVEAPSEDYALAISPVWARMGSIESDHFVLWAENRDEILRPYALTALEKAYSRIGAVMDSFPEEKIRVEIYRNIEDFSL